MEFPIIYEDDDIVVINKPIGLRAHPDGHNVEETVSDWFAERYPHALDVGEPGLLPNGGTVARPGIVHRLDRDTSGAMVLAKTQEAHAFLKNAFQEREVHKTYLAFVYGTFKEEKKGVIEFAIGRSRKDFRLRSAQPKAKGRMREALTKWEVIGENATHTLLKAEPLTGRTHQIRVHLKAIHHPIVCDALYAPKQKCDLGFKRLGLHAHTLELPLLAGGTKVFTASVPDDLKAALPLFPGAAEYVEAQG